MRLLDLNALNALLIAVNALLFFYLIFSVTGRGYLSLDNVS